MSAFGPWPRTGTNKSPLREVQWRISFVMRINGHHRKPGRPAGRGERPGGGTSHPGRSAHSNKALTAGIKNWLKIKKGLGQECSRLFLWGSMMPRGAPGIKNPLPVTTFRRGYQRRTVWTPTHTARLRAWRRLHCSAPHGKGYCHTDRPTTKPWGFTLTTNL